MCPFQRNNIEGVGLRLTGVLLGFLIGIAANGLVQNVLTPLGFDCRPTRPSCGDGVQSPEKMQAVMELVRKTARLRRKVLAADAVIVGDKSWEFRLHWTQRRVEIDEVLSGRLKNSKEVSVYFFPCREYYVGNRGELMFTPLETLSPECCEYQRQVESTTTTKRIYFVQAPMRVHDVVEHRPLLGDPISLSKCGGGVFCPSECEGTEIADPETIEIVKRLIAERNMQK